MKVKKNIKGHRDKEWKEKEVTAHLVGGINMNEPFV